MKVKIISLRPFFDIDGQFVNIPGAPTFDPKHPQTYPGLEVTRVETLTIKDALDKHGKDALMGPDLMYCPIQHSGKADALIAIFELTGRTSAQVVYGD